MNKVALNFRNIFFKITFLISTLNVLLLFSACRENSLDPPYIQTVSGREFSDSGAIWLTHEHVLVDFIGADSISDDRWDRKKVIGEVLPYLEDLNSHDVVYFVDATPAYLGRDAGLLVELSELTGLRIITNTGLYGARGNKFVPDYALSMSPVDLSDMWIAEFRKGIGGGAVKPGFIKISVDASDTLHPVHLKLVSAAALTLSCTDTVCVDLSLDLLYDHLVI